MNILHIRLNEERTDTIVEEIVTGFDLPYGEGLVLQSGEYELMVAMLDDGTFLVRSDTSNVIEI